MTAVYVVATFNVKPNHQDAGRTLIEGFVAPSLEQRGCLFYDLYQCADDPCELVIVDGWASPEDLDRHANSSHVQETVSKLAPLLDKPAQVKVYRKLL